MPFFQTDDVRLFYTVQGVGDPILLLHGYACDSHDWSYQIPLLAGLGFSVIALDQRGHGRSSTPPSTDTEAYSLRSFANDAAQLLSHLHGDTKPAFIVGHSMGTVIASIMATEYQNVVRGLILVHPIYCGVHPALSEIGRLWKATPEEAPAQAAQFFEKAMYTERTPDWLKTWQTRRVLGTDPKTLIGCIEGMDQVSKFMDRSDFAKQYMRDRKGPRLAVCTNALPAAEEWEEEIGVVNGRDEIHVLTEGTFSHMVENKKFNKIMEDWLLRHCAHEHSFEVPTTGS